MDCDFSIHGCRRWAAVRWKSSEEESGSDNLATSWAGDDPMELQKVLERKKGGDSFAMAAGEEFARKSVEVVGVITWRGLGGRFWQSRLRDTWLHAQCEIEATPRDWDRSPSNLCERASAEKGSLERV
jgi:hypothetical protein